MSAHRILISAGEPSGDLHAAHLVRALHSLDSSLQFVGFGGDHMREAGVSLLEHHARFSVVGLVEALQAYRQIRALRHRLLDAARDVDLAVLVDYPGFHLRLARDLKRMGIPVLYYIVPQVWAWGRWRVHTLRQTLQEALVILPFEETFLRRYGVPARYVGHPLMEQLEGLLPETLPPLPSDPPTLAFLPGSRPQEIQRLLPRMLKLQRLLFRRFPDGRFLFSILDPAWIPLVQREARGRVEIPDQPARSIIQQADFVVVASGTASLETGLMLKPMAVVYVLSDLSWWVARTLSRVPHASLVNLLLGHTVVPEYLQHLHYHQLADEIEQTLLLPARYRAIQRELKKLRQVLDPRKKSAREAAQRILFWLDRSPRAPLRLPFTPFAEMA